MKRLFLSGFFIFVLLAVVGLGALGVKLYGTRVVDSKLQRQVKKLSGKADISYGKVDLKLTGLDVEVNDVSVTVAGRTLSVSKVVVYDIDIEHKKPEYATIALQGISLPITEQNVGEAFKELNELGYRTLHADAYFDFVFREREQRLVINDCRVDIADVCAFRFQCAIAGFELKQLQAFLLDNVVVERLEFAYEDKSLLKKVVQIASVDEKEIIRFMTDGLNEDIARAKKQNSLEAASTMGEVARFIKAPGPLQINVALLKPAQIGHVMLAKKISQILALFSITVAAG